MKALILTVLVLGSVSNVFAMSEESETSCEKTVHVSAYQESVPAGEVRKEAEAGKKEATRK
ncbi:hypothetical protein [Bacteriovorax sp. Seq25_V]|uniref:hypothetical protein n=1 Tax=Bacteriovorax sp. Seq25_V TaxID=1201288 RepID=UPI000389E294|nr:hypothetical protein [Bacteriovorax sp. Seq25_V]EQC43228.1 hypothetical protein M900_0248 [Bacteriovorax sp. Seq25_V]